MFRLGGADLEYLVVGVIIVVVAMVAVVMMDVTIMMLVTILMIGSQVPYQGLLSAVIDVTVLLPSRQHHHADQANAVC